MLRPSKLVPTVLVMLALSAAEATAAKPPKNPPPPETPPVRYQVRFWSIAGASHIIDVYDTNNAGQTVGSCNVNGATHAYLYDPVENAELGFDLNDVVSNIPPGWLIRKATAINEVGQIAAYIEPIDAPLAELESVMVDMNQDPPVMHIVPDRDFTSYSLPGDINDWGDIIVRYDRIDGTLGHYVFNFDPDAGIPVPLDLGISTTSGSHPRINNTRTVVGLLGGGVAYRLTWNGQVEEFVDLSARALNENGAFCGSASSRKGKGNSFSSAFVYGSSLELLTGLPHSSDLNESRDVVFGYQMYHRNTDGTTTLYVLRNLLDPNDPVASTIVHESDLYCFTMTDRDSAAGFPVLTGNYNQGGVGFQLIPMSPLP